MKNDAITHTGHASPGDVWITLSQIIRQAFRRYTDDLQCSHDRKVDPKISFKLRKTHPLQESLRFVHCVQNIFYKIQKFTAHSDTTSC
jgi:hypothetical protein